MLFNLTFAPHAHTYRWEVELVVEAQGGSKPARLSVYNPSVRNAFKILDRSFSSNGYSISSTRLNNRSTIDFYRKDASRGDQEFSVRYQMERDLAKRIRIITAKSPRVFTSSERSELKEFLARTHHLKGDDTRSLVQQIFESSEVPSFLTTRQAKLQALAELGVAGKLYYGFRLSQAREVTSFAPFYIVVSSHEHFVYSFKEKIFLPREAVFLWGSSKEPLYEASGLSKLSWKLSAIPLQISLKPQEHDRRGWVSAFLQWFSLQRLSVEIQHSFAVLLLLPLASLIIAFLRNVIGFQTFGTFMPAILSLALRETGLFVGLFLLSLVLLLGIGLRILFKYFRLLLVPRLTATLTCVVLLLFVLSLIGMSLDMPSMTSLSLFPVVILSMIVERFSVSLEEYGPVYGLRIMFFSLVASVVSYLVITTPHTIYLFSAFPELNLCVLGVAILLGRYFGYRLFELFRFRELSPVEGARS